MCVLVLSALTVKRKRPFLANLVYILAPSSADVEPFFAD